MIFYNISITYNRYMTVIELLYNRFKTSVMAHTVVNNKHIK